LSQLERIDDHFFCEIFIDTKPAVMLFDTGATTSHISSKYTQNSKLVGYVKGAGQTGVLGKTKEVKEIHNIKIDDLLIDYHKFIIDDSVKKHFPNCDGVLGIDLLSMKNIKLDFKSNNFVFISDRINEGIPFSTNRNKIFFNPKINGIEVENLIFDTGAHNLSIEKELHKNLNLELLINDKELEIGDSNGNIIDYETYRIDTFEIDHFKKSNEISYGFCFKRSSKLKKIKQNGIIGKSIFDGHIFIFDFNSKLCTIK